MEWAFTITACVMLMVVCSMLMGWLLVMVKDWWGMMTGTESPRANVTEVGGESVNPNTQQGANQ
jgi:hypothetical protein